MTIIVKRATVDDVNEISKLFDAYRVFYKQQSDTNLAIRFLKERLGSSESVIFFATNDKGDYLGFTQLFPSFSSVTADRMWILNDLFVAEAARGHGVGTHLMNAAKAFAIETDAKGITLSTATDNRTAQSLYETLGYERDLEYYTYFLATRS
jgi:GNAT superfamily N-acetyltransferase